MVLPLCLKGNKKKQNRCFSESRIHIWLKVLSPIWVRYQWPLWNWQIEIFACLIFLWTLNHFEKKKEKKTPSIVSYFLSVNTLERTCFCLTCVGEYFFRLKPRNDNGHRLWPLFLLHITKPLIKGVITPFLSFPFVHGALWPHTSQYGSTQLSINSCVGVQILSDLILRLTPC